MGIPSTYPESFLRELFGISRQRVYHWRKKGILSPKTKGSKQGYSFSDLLTIKVITNLTGQGVRIGHISKANTLLKKLFPKVRYPLLEKSFIVRGKAICVLDNDKIIEAETGQIQLFQPGDLLADLKKDIEIRIIESSRKSDLIMPQTPDQEVAV